MQHPIQRTFTISKIEPRQTSPNGYHHLDCETDAGWLDIRGLGRRSRRSGDDGAIYRGDGC